LTQSACKMTFTTPSSVTEQHRLLQLSHYKYALCLYEPTAYNRCMQLTMVWLICLLGQYL